VLGEGEVQAGKASLLIERKTWRERNEGEVLDHNEGNTKLLKKRDDADIGPPRGYM
jgi:hypothetical protein